MSSAQSRLVAFVKRYQSQNQRPPSSREMMAHMGFKSPRAVTYHIDVLVTSGVLFRRGTRGESRNIFVKEAA